MVEVVGNSVLIILGHKASELGWANFKKEAANTSAFINRLAKAGPSSLTTKQK